MAVIAGATPTSQISASNVAKVYYIHTDHLDTPRMVTDAAGNKRWSWSIATGEPFGASPANEAPQTQAVAQQFTLNLRFPGQYLDKETGTFYNYHRTYNPATGRYLQSDPIGLKGGLNTFGYVEGNPTNLVDLDGQNPAAIARAGRIGYQIGEAINPVVQPIIARLVDAYLLPDPINDLVTIAQNNKQIRKRIEGLERNIAEHKRKIEQEPDCNATNHWRSEIKAWESEVARLRLRLPNGR